MPSRKLDNEVGFHTGCNIFHREADGYRRRGTCHSSKLVGEWRAVGPLLLPALPLGKGQPAVLVGYEQSDRAYN